MSAGKMGRPVTDGNTRNLAAPSASRKVRGYVEISPTADVVFAGLPNGRHRIIRGVAMLERIIASGRVEKAEAQYLGILSDAEADELARQHGAN